MNSRYSVPCVDDSPIRRLHSENFFCALPQKALKAFNQIKHATAYPARVVIFSEGQASRGIFILCEGQAKVSTASRVGKTVILRAARPGEVLGLQATITDTPYESTVEAMQPSMLNFVNRQDFQRFLKEHGDVCLHIAQQISRDWQSAYDRIRSMALSHSASERVAKFLLGLAAGGSVTDGKVRTEFTMTHEDIA